MSYRVASNTLNASTVDILNVIRQNASYEYQSAVPVVEQYTDIPKVGEVIYGTPALANQFINALVNRIALVRAKGATFNNPYSALKKGYLAYGETVEEIFVNIAKVVDFRVDEAGAREFRRTLPDVQTAFHAMNWRVMYPVTIQDEDLRQAFLTVDGVTELIAKIVDSIYTAAEYDEYLLFKYLLIKGYNNSQIYREFTDTTDLTELAASFRGMSNMLTFMSDDYNELQVKNNTPKDRQVIFMDAKFNAEFDVEVLASAFNMDKADFMGKLYLVDSFTKFDNDRFNVIRSQSDGLEEVTDDELAQMADVKAILVDADWFQVYDNQNKFTEKYVASGLYWNYFYHTWKTISHSPFANAVAFVAETYENTVTSLEYTLASFGTSDDGVYAISLEPVDSNEVSAVFLETEDLASNGIAVTPQGAIYATTANMDAAIESAVTLVVQDAYGNQYASLLEGVLGDVGSVLIFSLLV